MKRLSAEFTSLHFTMTFKPLWHVIFRTAIKKPLLVHTQEVLKFFPVLDVAGQQEEGRLKRKKGKSG